MDQDHFWKIIDQSNKSAKGDQEAQLELLTEFLTQLEPGEIVKFGEELDRTRVRAFQWGLWGAAYIINGGCSDDGFIYFIPWLISKGRKTFESALANPDSLVETVKNEDVDFGCEFEDLNYLPCQVWEEKTGKEMDEFPRSSVEHPRVPTGKEWRENGDDLQRMFPRLWKRFVEEAEDQDER